MNDKRELLGSLSIDDTQRSGDDKTARYVVTGLGAVILAAAAWFFLVPDSTPVTVSIATAEAASGNVDKSSNAVLDASGYVTARRQATVSSKTTGKVVDVFVEEGLEVKEGQLLATLDASTQEANLALAKSQLTASRSKLEEVRVQIQQSELEYNRTVELTEKKLASTADLDRARLSLAGLKARLAGLERDVEVTDRSMALQQQLLADMEIRAPFAGVVVTKAAQPGEMISPVSAGGGFTRTGICTIVDMDSLEVEVDVNESYINRVVPGQEVIATLNSYPDWRIPAEVITIIPTADRNKATVRVRIGFLEKDKRILPDMGVKVSFLEESQQAKPEQATALTGVFVPAAAVRVIEDQSVVFVVADGRVNVRDVKVGQRVGAKRNVVSGLAAGEQVVTGLTDELVTQLTEGRPVTTAKS